MFHGIEFLKIEQLTLENGEEALDNRIVQAVTLAAHTLSDTFLS